MEPQEEIKQSSVNVIENINKKFTLMKSSDSLIVYPIIGFAFGIVSFVLIVVIMALFHLKAPSSFPPTFLYCLIILFFNPISGVFWWTVVAIIKNDKRAKRLSHGQLPISKYQGILIIVFKIFILICLWNFLLAFIANLGPLFLIAYFFHFPEPLFTLMVII